MWLPVLLQAIIGFWYLKIESGEEVSLSKFTHKTGDTSSDIFAGFTSGDIGFWYFKKKNIESGEEVSLTKFTHKTGETSSDMIVGFTPGYHWLLIFQNTREEVSPYENSARYRQH